MTFRRLANFGTILCSGVLAGGLAPAQQPKPDAVPDSGAVIRTETKVVLVDTVVTDKKGNYVRNLTAKDFKVWEDNKEQTIKSFSFESDPAAPGELADDATSCSSSTTRPWIPARRRRPARLPRSLSTPTPGRTG